MEGYNIENLDFDDTLIFEGFLVLDDFDGNQFLGLPAFALDYLSECPFAHQIYNFVSKCYHLLANDLLSIFRRYDHI